jgi:hypothetical protein
MAANPTGLAQAENRVFPFEAAGRVGEREIRFLEIVDFLTKWI